MRRLLIALIPEFAMPAVHADGTPATLAVPNWPLPAGIVPTP